MRPWRACSSSNSATTSVSTATSTDFARCLPSGNPASSAAAAPSLSAITTVSPFAPKRRTTAAPMPFAPPVTSTIRASVRLAGRASSTLGVPSTGGCSSPGWSNDIQPPVDRQHRSGDVTRLRAGQKTHGPGDLVGARHAPHRHAAAHRREVHFARAFQSLPAYRSVETKQPACRRATTAPMCLANPNSCTARLGGLGCGHPCHFKPTCSWTVCSMSLVGPKCVTRSSDESGFRFCH